MNSPSEINKDKILALVTSGPHNLIALVITLLTAVTLYLPYAEMPRMWMEYKFINPTAGKITLASLVLLAVCLYGGASGKFTRSLGALSIALYVYQIVALFSDMGSRSMSGRILREASFNFEVLVAALVGLLLLLIFAVIKKPQDNPQSI